MHALSTETEMKLKKGQDNPAQVLLWVPGSSPEDGVLVNAFTPARRDALHKDQFNFDFAAAWM